MIKTLFISGAFLKKNAPVSIVERAFLKGLNETGQFDVKIACYKDEIAWQKDQLFIINKNIFLEFILKVFRRLKFFDLVNRPDENYFFWGKRAIKKIKTSNKLNGVNYIHSFSLACSNHIVALKLKEQYGIPVVAQFFDPWYNNPYRPIKSKKIKLQDYELEKYVAINADIIIHDNENIANVWIERYGDIVKNKIYVLPLVFTIPRKIEFVNDTKRIEKKLVISHIGNLYSSRDSKYFADALHEVKKKHPNVANKIKVYFIGDIPLIQKQYFDKLGLNAMIEYTGRLNEENCYKYYSDSDMFLAIDGINELDVFYPSKLMKYFYFQKPIIGITPSNSVMDIELKKSGNYTFAHSEIMKISDLIYNAILDYKTVLQPVDKNYWKKFTPESVVKEYVKIINSFS